MHRRLAAARAGENLVRAAGDHLVDVHIALGAAAGLPDDERELIVEMAGGDLGCGPLDGVGLVGGKAVAPVDARCRLLAEGERMDDLDRHPPARATEIGSASWRERVYPYE